MSESEVEAVRSVMLHYARGIDRRDWDEVRNCFAPEARVEGTRFSGPRDEYLARLFPGVEAFPVTMHKIGNHLVEVDDDTATTETYLTAYHFADTAGTDEQLTLGVIYRDELSRKDDGAWRIDRRHVTQVWSRGPTG